MRAFEAENYDWTIVRKNIETKDMYSRYAHCVGGFSNFLVTFGGQGKYEEKTKFREQFNDIAVFDVYNN